MCVFEGIFIYAVGWGTVHPQNSQGPIHPSIEKNIPPSINKGDINKRVPYGQWADKNNFKLKTRREPPTD